MNQFVEADLKMTCDGLDFLAALRGNLSEEWFQSFPHEKMFECSLVFPGLAGNKSACGSRHEVEKQRWLPHREGPVDLFLDNKQAPVKPVCQAIPDGG